MNRKFTNKIRYILDEWVPPFIRNSFWFMYPVFFIVYQGKNLKRVMNFKSLARSLSENELNKLYKEVDIISRNRKTDLAESNITYILNHIENGQSVIDVGCGKGYLLSRIRQAHPKTVLNGFDLENNLEYESIPFTSGTVTSIPFPDKHFDVVICTHTIEHILPLDKAIQELIRIAKKKLIIVTPCQKYFYYTIDGHLNFFYTENELLRHLPLVSFVCVKLDMDWVYIGDKSVSD